MISSAVGRTSGRWGHLYQHMEVVIHHTVREHLHLAEILILPYHRHKLILLGLVQDELPVHHATDSDNSQPAHPPEP